MHCFGQQGLVPALDSDMAEVITGTEFMVKAYADYHSLTATAVNDLIKNVLKNQQFNVDEVETDMLQCLSASIDRGDLQIISMGKEGGGAQNPLKRYKFLHPLDHKFLHCWIRAHLAHSGSEQAMERFLSVLDHSRCAYNCAVHMNLKIKMPT